MITPSASTTRGSASGGRGWTGRRHASAISAWIRSTDDRDDRQGQLLNIKRLEHHSRPRILREIGGHRGVCLACREDETHTGAAWVGPECHSELHTGRVREVQRTDENLRPDALRRLDCFPAGRGGVNRLDPKLLKVASNNPGLSP